MVTRRNANVVYTTIGSIITFCRTYSVSLWEKSVLYKFGVGNPLERYATQCGITETFDCGMSYRPRIQTLRVGYAKDVKAVERRSP